MSILSHFNSALTIASKDPGCTEEEIQELITFSPVTIPHDYLGIVREATEVEIKVNLAAEGQWFLRIWGPINCIDMNTAYNIQEVFPESLAIGDNEGCGLLVYLPSDPKPGIYLVRTSYIHKKGAVYIAQNLTELLTNGNNLRLVFKTE